MLLALGDPFKRSPERAEVHVLDLRISSTTLLPPLLQRLSKADAAFSCALEVPVSKRLISKGMAETLRNVSTLSAQPAVCASTARASSTTASDAFFCTRETST